MGRGTLLELMFSPVSRFDGLRLILIHTCKTCCAGETSSGKSGRRFWTGCPLWCGNESFPAGSGRSLTRHLLAWVDCTTFPRVPNISCASLSVLTPKLSSNWPTTLTNAGVARQRDRCGGHQVQQFALPQYYNQTGINIILAGSSPHSNGCQQWTQRQHLLPGKQAFGVGQQSAEYGANRLQCHLSTIYTLVLRALRTWKTFLVARAVTSTSECRTCHGYWRD